MKVSDCTAHVKKSATHRMMITKLQTYKDDELATLRANNLQVLKDNAETSNWFVNSIRIPRFDFVQEENVITIQSEFMFGRQLHPQEGKDWHQRIYDEMVDTNDINGYYGFKDYTFMNFIIRGNHPLSNDEPNWNISYVDLEGFCRCTKEDRKVNFAKNYERWLE